MAQTVVSIYVEEFKDSVEHIFRQIVTCGDRSTNTVRWSGPATTSESHQVVVAGAVATADARCGRAPCALQGHRLVSCQVPFEVAAAFGGPGVGGLGQHL